VRDPANPDCAFDLRNKISAQWPSAIAPCDGEITPGKNAKRI
jgi:hypothetical protein